MTIVPTLLLGAQLVVPVSDQVPTLDVAVSCKAATKIAIAEAQSYDACMADEKSAREQLVKTWHSYAASERTQCTTEATMTGSPSYVELLVCLEIARDADAPGKIKLKGARKKR